LSPDAIELVVCVLFMASNIDRDRHHTTILGNIFLMLEIQQVTKAKKHPIWMLFVSINLGECPHICR
jgi:hypothetical protein